MKTIKLVFRIRFFICSMLNTISCNLLRKNIIMSFLRMIRIREIAGRPITHWISPKFIEDLPLDGDESFQQSLIGIRDMLKPIFIKNLNVKGMKCHFQEFNLYLAMKDWFSFSEPREHELSDFLFDLSFEVESNLMNIKPGDTCICNLKTYFKFMGTFRIIFGCTVDSWMCRNVKSFKRFKVFMKIDDHNQRLRGDRRRRDRDKCDLEV